MWNFNRFQNNIALIESNNTKFSYKELVTEIDGLQNQIREPRSLIFIMTQNNIESLVGYLFAIEFCHVPFLINAEIQQKLLEVLIKSYKPNYLFISEEIDFKHDEYLQDENGYRNYKIFRQKKRFFHDLNPDLALLLSTSGSTGNPKLIRISKANIESNMKVISKYLNLSESDRSITTLPINYTYGLSIINSHLYAGASIILTDTSIVDKHFWQLFDEYQPTSLNGVPYTYQLLKRLLKPHHLSSLRYMTQAGGHLGSTLQEYFANFANEHHVDFYIMYGQTEATARMSYLSPSRVLDKLDSIGQAIPGGRFELVSEDGTLITSPHELGELIYYGPNVTMGYSESQEDLSLGDKCLGRLATGDLAIMDEEGYYFIQGRKNRYVKVYGVRVNLDDVEKEVVRVVGSHEIAIVGIEDRIDIYTVVPIDSNVTIEVANKFGIHPSVFKTNFINEIPKNQAGKILYSALNESSQR
jgi:long-chain acyl-CoA synthetase